MAGQTPRFGLNYFGGSVEGELSDDGDKYTSEDRLTIDAVLAALEKHTHHPTTALSVPSEIPDLSYTAGGGALEGGTTYYYVVSYVNAQGLETIAGPEASLATPDVLPAPVAPSGETDTVVGNTLAAGTYYYALTGLRTGGEESPLGPFDTVTVLSDENTVILTLPALGDADSYQIWRQKDTDGGWTRVGTSATGTFTDDGSVPAAIYGDPANIPPLTATGADNYAITITLTGDDLTDVQDATAWRIYRSTDSGTYSSASLVHEVVERVDDLDPDSDLLTSWVDDGDEPLTGSPKLVSSELTLEPFVFEHATPLPAATGYPNYYPIINDGDGKLYYANAGTWTPVASVTRGVALFTGTGDPTGAEPADALAGDVYIDTSTGDIYVLDGP